MFKSLPLGFPHPIVKYVGDSLGRPYLVGIVGRRLLQLLQLMTCGHRRRRGPVEVFGRAASRRAGALVRVIVLRSGSRQRRSAAGRISSGSVLLQVVILRRFGFATALFDAAAYATADGRTAVALVVDGLPVAGQRLVRLALGPRLTLLRVTAAVRRRRPGLHRARRRLDHRYLAGLMLRAVSAAAASLMSRLGAAAAAVFVLAVIEVVMVVVVLLQVVVVRVRCGDHR